MYPDKVYNQMALILRDQKCRAPLEVLRTSTALKTFRGGADVLPQLLAYGRILLIFPLMRAFHS